MNLLDHIKRKAGTWHPRFSWESDVDKCADCINVPHDDYPQRVDATKQAICDVVTVLSDESEKIDLAEQDMKNIHAKVMRDSHIRTGEWRRMNVSILNSRGEVLHRPPDSVHVPMLMMSCLPVDLYTDLEEWYALFQTIHPFEDGNGRVGGIVVAALSYLSTGRYLTARQ